MKFFAKESAFLAAPLPIGETVTAMAQSRGKVLVVMSGEHLLNLRR